MSNTVKVEGMSMVAFEEYYLAVIDPKADFSLDETERYVKYSDVNVQGAYLIFQAGWSKGASFMVDYIYKDKS